MDFKEIFGRSSPMAKFIFILIVLYAAVSVYILLWALGAVNNVFTSDTDATWIGFAIISFAMATLISAYHLSTMIFRRKRRADKLADMNREISA